MLIVVNVLFLSVRCNPVVILFMSYFKHSFNSIAEKKIFYLIFKKN